MILISEIFYSIQGEGKRIGTPSYFIRVAGCNLRCKGFGVKYQIGNEEKTGCDTYYAVDPVFKTEWKYFENFHEIIEELKKIGYKEEEKIKRDIVITGGEPLLYWNNDEFQKLIIYFISRGHKVTIETNASLDIEFTKPYQKNILFSMSVKLSNSGENYEKRVNLNTINKILENSPESYLKFVVNQDEKLFEEIFDILNKIPYFTDIYFMSLGSTKKELIKNEKYVINKCLECGFNYSPRLHINIWDNERRR